MARVQCVNAQFLWTVHPPDFPLEPNNGPNLFVVKKLVPGRQYRFSVNITIDNVTQTEFVTVDVKPMKPTGFIGGGNRPFPWDRELRLQFVKTFKEEILVRGVLFMQCLLFHNQVFL